MQIIIDVLVALFGLTRAAYNNVDLDRARKFHGFYVAKMIWFSPIFITVMIGLNYFGIKWVNLLIALLLNLIVLTLITRPEALLATIIGSATFGAFSSSNMRIINDYLRRLDEAKTDEEKARLQQGLDPAIADALKNKDSITFLSEFRSTFFLILRTLGDIVFWISIFGMFLGTISCRNNPGAVLVIAITLIVIGYGSYRWEMGPTIYKWIIYNYAVLTLIISILSLVPAYTWIHWTGHDLGAFFHSSKMEEKLAEVEQKEKQFEEGKNEAILDGIMEKLDAKKPLSASDKKFMETMREKRESNSLPARISEKFSQMSREKTSEVATITATLPPAPAPTASIPPPAPTPKKVWQMCIDENCYTAEEITINDNSMSITMAYPGGKAFFKGTFANDHYEGDWWQTTSRVSRGRFCLKKTLAGDFIGEESVNGRKKPIPIELILA